MDEISKIKATLSIKRFFSISAKDNSEEVELLACRKTMEFAIDDGFSEFVIEEDNVTIIKSPLISGSHLPRTCQYCSGCPVFTQSPFVLY